jgi:hypothetical protein
MLQAYDDYFPFGDCDVLMLFLLNANCASFVGKNNVRWFCLVKKVYIGLNDKQHTHNKMAFDLNLVL